MASIANTFSFHFILLILCSLSLQPHARESKFFTKVVHYLSDSRITPLSSVPAPAPLLMPKFAPVTESFFSPAPAPTEKEYGYGLYGQGSSEYSSEEYHAPSLNDSSDESVGDEEEKASPVSEDFTSEKGAPFEKLLSSESYSTSDNGYSNNVNGYSKSVNENKGYNQNEYKNNRNGYNDYEQNSYTNENHYSQNGYNHHQNGYNQNMYSNNYNDNVNEYSSSMNENSGYKTDRYSQNYNDNDNKNNHLSFTNENNGYNSEYTSSKEENNGHNAGYMVEQQGLSDTRFLENGMYSYDANNNGNKYGKSHEEEVRGIGDLYKGNNDKSKYEFDTMEDYERQEGYPQSYQRGYVP